MKFFRLDLLTLLISLFILNSCKNQDTIGLGLNTGNQINGTLVDTATIIANTIPEDSVLTMGLTKTPLAYLNDNTFGTTEANIAMDLNLPNKVAYTLPAGTITIDSAILVLKYADGFYGDSIGSQYKVNVFQLNEKPSSSQGYYNNKQWNYNTSNLLGSKTFNSRTHTKYKITDIVPGGPDTAIRVDPELRIPISTSFIQNNLFGASATQLASNLVFQNTVKGLYITLDKNQTTGAGGTFMFNSPADSVVHVYVRINNGTTIDTTIVYLPVSVHAAEIRHTRSATVQGVIDNQSSSNDVIYLQGLAGTRARVSFPYLKNLGNDIILNRAELVITPVPGTELAPFVPLPKLTMYRYDIAHQRIELQDASTNDPRALGLFGGYYGASNASQPKQYHFLVTAYIQDLIRGKTVDYGTFIAPVDTTNTTSVDIAATPQVAARTIAIGTLKDKNSPNYPYRIKLNIIYTKISK